MGRHSGYDSLYDHFAPDVFTDSIFCNFKKMYPRGIGRFLSIASKYVSRSNFYNAQSVEAEFKLLLQSVKDDYNIIHYSYGEPYFGLSGFAPRLRKAPIVITHHQPVSWWKKHEQLLRKYDHKATVIALSTYDTDYFNSHAGLHAVCIPHGVDTAFYTPFQRASKKASPSFRVVFAGRYMRDMHTLATVIKKISSSSMKIQFDIIYGDRTKITDRDLIDIIPLSNVNWHTDVSDQELLALYQQADCCLIPLEECTANNAILEAMACGLPILTTELPAVKTYVDDSMAILGRKKNANDLCDAIYLLYHDEEKRSMMASNARKRAIQNFDWGLIACQTIDLFKSL